MAGPTCCVDQTRPGTRILGGRWFCEAHYQRAIYQRGRVWRSSALAMAALLVTPGASPLDPDSGASLRQAVRAAHAALGVTPPGSATPVVRRVARPTVTSTS